MCKLALASFLLIIGVANAQLGLGLFGGNKPPAAPGAGRSFADVVCADQELTTLCGLIQTAGNNPTVAELTDPTFTGTLFAPTNKGFENDQRRITRQLGTPSIADLQKDPKLAARLLSEHIITGQALQRAQLKNDAKYKNAAGDTIEIDTGVLGGIYIRGPTGHQPEAPEKGSNIPAARGYIQKINGVLVPKKA